MCIAKKCGKELPEGTKFCPDCGANLGEEITLETTKPVAKKSSSSSIGWLILGLLFPIVGLILFIVWKDDKPEDSKAAGKGALIGVIVGFALSIISIIISFALAGTMVMPY